MLSISAKNNILKGTKVLNIGIVGYGNLGRGVEAAVKSAPDMNLVGMFTRRNTDDIKSESPCFSYDDLQNMKDQIDVAILCGGSATDLPLMTPEIAANFNVVDSFDTHANIPDHLRTVDAAAKASGKIAIISTGWDPGLFSLARLYANAVLPDGTDYTFWGKGISQGHSDAIRRIEGVIDARQYTIPVQSAMERVRSGESPSLTTREKHTRECFVVAEEGADLDRIESEIRNMPNYFSDYDTTVNFISAEELAENHSGMLHGGSVIRSGVTAGRYNNTIEFSLKLDSNPFFTGSVLASFARAAYRLNAAGECGCKTVFDIPPILLMAENREDVIAHML
ncbi:MAG: diaminopimelate dehydrogenase [Firmicutes bacterium]|nr:diaminopimelate dehydrogenase [Bacillota bacterium]